MRNRKHIPALVALLLLCLPALAAAQSKVLTVEDIFDPVKRVNFGGPPPAPIEWLSDGEHYLQGKTASGATQLMKIDARTGEAVPFFDAAKMEAALMKLPAISADDARRLAHRASYHLNPAQNAVVINFNSDLIYYELNSDTAARLTTDPEEESEEDFSSDGRMVSFVRGGDLYVIDLATRHERRLTKTGSDTTFNGRLDWVYEEEVYGRGNKRGYWWSPDSTRIAYLSLDEKPVHDFPVVDHIPRRQVLEDTPYPLAGDPNPFAKLGIVEAAGGDTRWVDTAEYQPADLLLVRVTWSPDSRRVVYQAQNREQTFLDLNAAEASTGKSSKLFRETTRAWVEPTDDNPDWLKDGSFLWRSERNGWMHLYHYSPDGRLIKQITDGKWEVRGIDGVDESSGFIYFHGTEHSHIAEHVYRVRLDGSGLTRLTQTEGTHNANFNPTNTLFVDRWSDINTPPQVRLFKSDGSLVRVVDENRVEALGEYKLGRPEFLQVKTRDGFPMEAMIIRPPDFDPSKKYPVLEFTYSGPHAPQVHNAWGGTTYMWHQLLAEKGYIIWYCDNRTASGKGAESAWPVYKNFGELELKDLEDGLNYLKSQPYVDGSRIGLWGWSFGGFMTSYALTHSTSYKIGISGGTVTDWANYDSIYTERYMMTPEHNPEGYKVSSPTAAAANLHGKLLLIHGAIDDNVHVANTMQFIYALQKADREFQLMLYPKSRHGVTDPLLVRHMRQMMTDFILANL
ncbi:MAG TPA: S9 family peptidase [Pyrinomonadaceae bacterium]|nr:S9 family peptidase [Pyrinomonadaceae bacterium]